VGFEHTIFNDESRIMQLEHSFWRIPVKTIKKLPPYC